MVRLEDARVRTGLLALVLLGCMALVSLRVVRTGSSFGGDGVHYYAQVRSLVVDRDLDLSNEFARLHEEVSGYTGNRKLPFMPPVSPVTGRPATLFPIGTALLLVPFFAAAHLVASLVAAAGGPPADGFTPIYFFATGLGAVVYTGAALVLLIRLGWRLGQGPATAFVGAMGILLGTPWLYYTGLDPSSSHAYAAFAVALFAAVLMGPAREGGFVWWLALGACAGLMGLVRYQDVALVMLAPAMLAWRWRESAARPARTFVRLAALAIGVIAVVAIQLAVHRYLYGSAFETGHRAVANQGFEYWYAPRLHFTALSAESGFLRWSPVIVLALLGLWQFRRRHALEAALCAAAILGQWYVMSAWTDLEQGDSFGNRHLVSSSAFLALGLMEAVRAAGERWPWATRDASRLVFLALVGGGTLVLMVLYSLRIIGKPY